jgi:endonuclease YncB( thermonuclease family)
VTASVYKCADLALTQSSDRKWHDETKRTNHTGHYTSSWGVKERIFVRFLRPSTVFVAAAISCLIYTILLSPVVCIAADFTGPVVSVLDGDTIEVLHYTSPERVRLSGIDCPEKGQAFGTRAKQAASALVFGKDVLLQTHGQDKYRRTLADVFLLDGTHVNHTLVKDGWCWWYRKYAPGDTVLEGLEKEAREAKKGLWADPRPVPPWEWRRSRILRH